jgi:hypothetical protein
MFEFELLKALPHEREDHATVSGAGPLEFEHRLFFATIRFRHKLVLLGNRWNRETLLSFSNAMFHSASVLSQAREHSFELPEGNDLVSIVRNGDMVTLSSESDSDSTTLSVFEFKKAASDFSRDALNAVLALYPELIRNTQIAGWYTDKKLLEKLGFPVAV